MAWFFSKKQTVSKEEFQGLIETIKKSFTNIKTDVSNLQEKTVTNQEQIKELQNILGYLNESIKTINNRIENIYPRPARQSRRIEEREPIQEDLAEQEQLTYSETKSTKKLFIEKLTEVQEEILKKVIALQRESPNKLISAKDVAQEMYPESQYAQVRPMISSYLDILEEFGYLKKIRKRRQVFIELKERGRSLSQTTQNSQIKISREKRNVSNKRKKI